MNLFVVPTAHCNLRNPRLYIIPRFRTVTYGKHSSSYLGPVLWSKLNKYTRLSDSPEIFKKRIKTVNLENLLQTTRSGRTCRTWRGRARAADFSWIETVFSDPSFIEAQFVHSWSWLQNRNSISNNGAVYCTVSLYLVKHLGFVNSVL